MAIILRLDRVMADRKISLNELAAKAGITNVNLSNIKTGKVCAIRFSTLMPFVMCWIASRGICWNFRGMSIKKTSSSIKNVLELKSDTWTINPSTAFRTYSCIRHRLRLKSLMEGTGNNILLLLGSKLNEVYCVPGHTDGQLRIILRMFLCISKHISL